MRIQATFVPTPEAVGHEAAGPQRVASLAGYRAGDPASGNAAQGNRCGRLGARDSEMVGARGNEAEITSEPAILHPAARR